MKRRNRYTSGWAFTDVVFNNLVAFTFLFFIAFLLIQEPIPKKKDIEHKAELIVILSWPDGDSSDIDLWVRSPQGHIVGFKNKEDSLIHLDRDDRGYDAEEIVTASGERIKNPINREVISIRGWIPGEWTVNVQAYHMDRNVDKDLPVSIELIRINPYKVLTKSDMILSSIGDEKTAFNFEVNQKDDLYFVKNINNVEDLFIMSKYSNHTSRGNW